MTRNTLLLRSQRREERKVCIFVIDFCSCGLRRKNSTQLAKYSRVLHVKPSDKGYLFLSVILFSGSRADEEEPDLGISYEVLPAGAGELPEVRLLL